MSAYETLEKMIRQMKDAGRSTSDVGRLIYETMGVSHKEVHAILDSVGFSSKELFDIACHSR